MINTLSTSSFFWFFITEENNAAIQDWRITPNNSIIKYIFEIFGVETQLIDTTIESILTVIDIITKLIKKKSKTDFIDNTREPIKTRSGTESKKTHIWNYIYSY